MEKDYTKGEQDSKTHCQGSAGWPLLRSALKVLEPYDAKVSCTVLRGRKLPGGLVYGGS
jgi:hypothetical protein